MKQSLITVIVPLAAEKVASVNVVLDQLGTPLDPKIRALAESDRPFVHFMSMVVVPVPGYEPVDEMLDVSLRARSKRAMLWPFRLGARLARWLRPPKAHLLIEVNADGTPKEALRRLAGAIPDELLRVLAAAGYFDLTTSDLASFLIARRYYFAPQWPYPAGLMFSGTPDMSVKRIFAEDKLATRIQELLNASTSGSALRKVQAIRRQIFEDDELKENFVSEPVGKVVGEARPVNYLKLLYTAFKQFGWLLLPLPLVALGLSFCAYGDLSYAAWQATMIFFAQGLAVGLAVWRGYKRLRRSEEEDLPFDEEPSEEHLAQILSRECTIGVQNHLTAISTMKTGWYRGAAVRGALWIIGESGVKRSKPGHIDKIGTIHFARWFILPGTNQLIFLSNYDGSWQSYLEDFIARLREGLSSVWSNTWDFPKTTNLIAGGAADGSRFKRWARRQQIPTRLWFTAYPHLSNDRIRTNAKIRHGFASASTEGEAAKWLSLFGYAARESLEAAEIPALTFGGMKHLRHAHCLLIDFAGSTRAADWLRAIEGEIAYGDGAWKPPLEKVTSVPLLVDPDWKRPLVTGFTRSGLEKLGLRRPALSTFPIAFQQDMHGRARALGDDPTKWNWGRGNVDAVLMIYETDAPRLAAAVARRKAQLESYGAQVAASIATSELPDEVYEPFGFRDGISQPVMGGTLRASRETNLANVVKAGEMVLGYCDNLGMVAPVPEALGLDIGRNGTFLVVRQLEQDTAAFQSYLDGKANELIANQDVRPPTLDPRELREWIGAKLVGRWKDGSSLIRNPHARATLKDPKAAPDNRFMYGNEDPDGLRCPLGSHIRRANPRDSFEGGSAKAIEISNRHRIMRVGRSYAPSGANPGLLFMCVNADIERQFEFLQQSWMLGPNFHGLANEVDPIVGCGKDRAMTVPTPNGPLQLKALSDFVTMRGGGYFFMPSRSTVTFLTRKVSNSAWVPGMQSAGYD